MGIEIFKYYCVLVNNSMVNKIKVTLSLSPDVLDKFKKYCEKRGMKVSSKVELMIKEELEKEN